MLGSSSTTRSLAAGWARPFIDGMVMAFIFRPEPEYFLKAACGWPDDQGNPGVVSPKADRSGRVPVAPAGDGGRAGLRAELGVDAVHVIFHGLLGEHQMGRDLTIGVTLGDERHDLGFAQRQAERAGHAGDAAGPHLTSGPRLPAVQDATHGMEAATCSARALNGTTCTRSPYASQDRAVPGRHPGPSAD